MRVLRNSQHRLHCSQPETRLPAFRGGVSWAATPLQQKTPSSRIVAALIGDGVARGGSPLSTGAPTPLSEAHAAISMILTSRE